MFPSLHYPNGLLRSLFSPLFKGHLVALLFVLVLTSGLQLRAQDHPNSSEGDPRLIDIKTIAQLEVFQFDTNGDGQVTKDDLAGNDLIFAPNDAVKEGLAGLYRGFYETGYGLAEGAKITCAGGCRGYELRNDLVFTSDDNNWDGSGSHTTGYGSKFNGNGHTISNLHISTFTSSEDASLTPTGFIGHFIEGTIENLGLINISINIDYTRNAGSLFYIGGLVGLAGDDLASGNTPGALPKVQKVNISNCYVTGEIVYMDNAPDLDLDANRRGRPSAIMGGLVGLHRAGRIDKCYASCNVAGYGFPKGSSSRTGGLAGSTVYVTNSHATGNVTGHEVVGGLVGELSRGNEADRQSALDRGFPLANLTSGMMDNCYATGSVTLCSQDNRRYWNEFVGGLAGIVTGTAGSSTVTNCYATGTLSYTDCLNKDGDVNTSVYGGLIGSVNALVANCYATGNVNAPEESPATGEPNGRVIAGGLVGILGTSGKIIGCYSLSSVRGGDDAEQDATSIPDGNKVSATGGLAAILQGTITASYYVGAISSGGNKGAIAGLLGADASINHSYFNSTLIQLPIIKASQNGISDPAPSRGLTTAELQTPAAYEGVYADWNVSTDGDDADTPDDPWDFCGTNQYPKLKADFDDDGTPSAAEFGNRNSCGSDAGGGGGALSVGEDADVLLYPNPVSGTLRLAGLDALKSYNYSVYSLVGKTLQRGVLQSDQTVDVSTLATGSYVFLLQSAGTEVLRSRVIIRK